MGLSFEGRALDPFLGACTLASFQSSGKIDFDIGDLERTCKDRGWFRTYI